MLDYPTGVFGLPLRLLAREVYDRVRAQVSESQVALVTGEERRVPARPRYWICTTEAMPTDLEADFLTVDEIQLVSHPTRGHVFTDRLLRARGVQETWFLGSLSVQKLIEHLLPAAKIKTYPRLSRLNHVGQKSLGKLPPRSAVVAFSVPEVYATAERLRHRKGGAAVVLGALSPRTRAAQVQMYQDGEVDYLVATDAIGMGLNLSISHVALAGTQKFDGQKHRPLSAAELGQIAGRAGRHLADGTFGTLAPVPSLPEGLARSIEEHRVERTRFGLYRNHDLDYSSLTALSESLVLPPKSAALRRIPNAVDSVALGALSRQTEIQRLATDEYRVRLLWETCRIPDYRRLLPEGHHWLVADVYRGLIAAQGRLGDDWLEQRIQRLETYEGDLDTLTSRLAFTRTWIYVCQRAGWVQSSEEWQQRTRSIEDQLSDAIHERLVQRFVERSQRRVQITPERKRSPSPTTYANPFDKLAELRKSLVQSTDSADAQIQSALASNEPLKLTLTSRGTVELEGVDVAVLRAGRRAAHPESRILHLPDLTTPAQKKLEGCISDFLRTVLDLRVHDPRLPKHGPARGILYQLQSGLGAVQSDAIRPQLRILSSDERRHLEYVGIRFGRHSTFIKRSMTREALRIRNVLAAVHSGSIPGFKPSSPTLPRDTQASPEAYLQRGYAVVGQRAIRCDTLEKCITRLSKTPRDTRTIGALLETRRDTTREIVADLKVTLRGRRNAEETLPSDDTAD